MLIPEFTTSGSTESVIKLLPETQGELFNFAFRPVINFWLVNQFNCHRSVTVSHFRANISTIHLILQLSLLQIFVPAHHSQVKRIKIISVTLCWISAYDNCLRHMRAHTHTHIQPFHKMESRIWK